MAPATPHDGRYSPPVLADVAGPAALAAHAERSDVTGYVLGVVEASTDEYARAYARTPPAELLTDVRVLARHVGALLDGRTTPAQRRCLMVAGGWLALLAATLYVDLGARRSAAGARTAAATLGREAEHDEIAAWSIEIDTWAALVDQD
ncbi:MULTISPECIES: hypothetical protein [Pseudonocardia]|uniref:Uncharacterized protein n=2 Tax=Pseudonocardia TaxID=1847 RepID=A0A1Y2MYX9_PSEAH|nr:MULTISPECIES: hypothetical protein [Pseudonocardia]OSY40416.1 hypothetical protein BG845_02820 [Pseudonocardia autotrophica]BBG02965.1 hypothetical protein Pdca_41740 [Pseudonocardia autotrophica]GEC25134.1 hypothetical protein PSA01_21630 [Pseudonocardia saturnea]